MDSRLNMQIGLAPVAEIDGFANVVTDKLRHVQQIYDMDSALGVLNGQAGTIWADGWEFNTAMPGPNSPHNGWSLGPDGDPGVTATYDNGDSQIDERHDLSEVGFAGSDGSDLDVNGDWIADSLIGAGYLVPGPGPWDYINHPLEVDAQRFQTIAQDTYLDKDWGSPEKSQNTGKYDD